MKIFSQLIRLFYINYVIAKRGLDRVVLSSSWFSSFRFLSYINPWNWSNAQGKTRGKSIRLALEDLGPIFVKFGQILSTRHDLLPEDIIIELQKLQDTVPPFSPEKAQEMLEQVYGQSIGTLFAEFSLTPLASASIAQVHPAVLFNGKKVVVKIRRPGIEKIIRRDLGLMYFVAGLGERFWSHGRRLHLRDLVAEFEHTILDELDFMREGANASQLRRNFSNSPLIYVPEIYWEYTSKSVLVMERISGIPIGRKDELIKAHINLKMLAERGVEIFFTQVFRDSFFHADMHPGNIFVSPEHPESPKYIAVDFGIMGSLGPLDQRYLAENLLAFFKRDYRRVALLHIESGWVPPNTRVEAFESAIRSVSEPIFEKPLSHISFAQLLLQLFQTASRFNMEVQPQLFLLQKTLLNVESLGKQLYPDLDLWTTAKPFLERWIRKRYGVKALLKKMIHEGPYLAETMLALPGLCKEVLEYQKKSQLSEFWKLQKAIKHTKKTKIRSFLGGVVLGGLLFTVFFYLLCH